MNYNGYQCHRNRLTGNFYAIPIGDTDFTRKITAATADELKRLIDAAVALDKRSANPWELPYRTATPAIAA